MRMGWFGVLSISTLLSAAALAHDVPADGAAAKTLGESNIPGLRQEDVWIPKR